MKKVILCLAVIFMAVSLNAQTVINYKPSYTTQISKEWFDRFLTKHKDSVEIVADLSPKNDYDDCQFPMLVIYKNKKVEIILFNIGDSSYITVSPKIPDIGDLNITKMSSSCSKDKATKLTHKTLIEAVRFKE